MSYCKVFVGGPSAVGKTTLLDYISRYYENALVSSMSFETLNNKYMGKKTAKEIADILENERNCDMIYEHSPLCMQLYKLIFKYKKLETFKITTFWEECLNLFSSLVYDDIFIIIDTTKFLCKRFYNRPYNKIDWMDNMYLYLQTVCYVSLMRNRHLCIGCKFIIIHDPDETRKNYLFNIYDELNLHNIIDECFKPKVDLKFVNKIDKRTIADAIMKNHIISLKEKQNLEFLDIS